MDENYKVVSIGWKTFSDYKKLKYIKIPNSITFIGKEAFEYCTDLRSIQIPSSVKTIGGFAFWNCKNLKEIIVLNPIPPKHNSGIMFDDNTFDTATLYVPNQSLERYKNAAGWKRFKNIKAYYR